MGLEDTLHVGLSGTMPHGSYSRIGDEEHGRDAQASYSVSNRTQGAFKKFLVGAKKLASGELSNEAARKAGEADTNIKKLGWKLVSFLTDPRVLASTVITVGIFATGGIAALCLVGVGLAWGLYAAGRASYDTYQSMRARGHGAGLAGVAAFATGVASLAGLALAVVGAKGMDVVLGKAASHAVENAVMHVFSSGPVWATAAEKAAVSVAVAKAPEWMGGMMQWCGEANDADTDPRSSPAPLLNDLSNIGSRESVLGDRRFPEPPTLSVPSSSTPSRRLTERQVTTVSPSIRAVPDPSLSSSSSSKKTKTPRARSESPKLPRGPHWRTNQQVLQRETSRWQGVLAAGQAKSSAFSPWAQPTKDDIKAAKKEELRAFRKCLRDLGLLVPQQKLPAWLMNAALVEQVVGNVLQHLEIAGKTQPEFQTGNEPVDSHRFREEMRAVVARSLQQARLLGDHNLTRVITQGMGRSPCRQYVEFVSQRGEWDLVLADHWHNIGEDAAQDLPASANPTLEESPPQDPRAELAFHDAMDRDSRVTGRNLNRYLADKVNGELFAVVESFKKSMLVRGWMALTGKTPADLHRDSNRSLADWESRFDRLPMERALEILVANPRAFDHFPDDPAQREHAMADLAERTLVQDRENSIRGKAMSRFFRRADQGYQLAKGRAKWDLKSLVAIPENEDGKGGETFLGEKYASLAERDLRIRFEKHFTLKMREAGYRSYSSQATRLFDNPVLELMSEGDGAIREQIAHDAFVATMQEVGREIGAGTFFAPYEKALQGEEQRLRPLFARRMFCSLGSGEVALNRRRDQATVQGSSPIARSIRGGQYAYSPDAPSLPPPDRQRLQSMGVEPQAQNATGRHLAGYKLALLLGWNQPDQIVPIDNPPGGFIRVPQPPPGTTQTLSVEEYAKKQERQSLSVDPITRHPEGIYGAKVRQECNRLNLLSRVLNDHGLSPQSIQLHVKMGRPVGSDAPDHRVVGLTQASHQFVGGTAADAEITRTRSKNPDARDAAIWQGKWFPPEVPVLTREEREQFLSLRPSELRDALREDLSDPELDALVERLENEQERVRNLPPSCILVDNEEYGSERVLRQLVPEGQPAEHLYARLLEQAKIQPYQRNEVTLRRDVAARRYEHLTQENLKKKPQRPRSGSRVGQGSASALQNLNVVSAKTDESGGDITIRVSPAEFRKPETPKNQGIGGGGAVVTGNNAAHAEDEDDDDVDDADPNDSGGIVGVGSGAGLGSHSVQSGANLKPPVPPSNDANAGLDEDEALARALQESQTQNQANQGLQEQEDAELKSALLASLSDANLSINAVTMLRYKREVPQSGRNDDDRHWVAAASPDVLNPDQPAYREQQDQHRCAIHAVNQCLGSEVLKDPDIVQFHFMRMPKQLLSIQGRPLRGVSDEDMDQGIAAVIGQASQQHDPRFVAGLGHSSWGDLAASLLAVMGPEDVQNLREVALLQSKAGEQYERLIAACYADDEEDKKTQIRGVLADIRTEYFDKDADYDALNHGLTPGFAFLRAVAEQAYQSNPRLMQAASQLFGPDLRSAIYPLSLGIDALAQNALDRQNDVGWGVDELDHMLDNMAVNMPMNGVHGNRLGSLQDREVLGSLSNFAEVQRRVGQLADDPRVDRFILTIPDHYVTFRRDTNGEWHLIDSRLEREYIVDPKEYVRVVRQIELGPRNLQPDRNKWGLIAPRVRQIDLNVPPNPQNRSVPNLHPNGDDSKNDE